MRSRCLNCYNWDYKWTQAGQSNLETVSLSQNTLITAASWQLIVIRLKYDYFLKRII